MILKRFGETVQGVDLDFDSRALTEIGFRRNRGFSADAESFERAYVRVSEHELTANSESAVQDEGESALLDELEGKVRELEEGLGENEVLLVENRSDDHPKTRDVKKEVIVGGKNRLHFIWRVEPALRVGIYRKKDG